MFFVLAPKQCAKSADIAFIMQSSDSIGIKDYQIQKDFIKAVAESFGITPSGSRAGVVISGNDTTANIKFSDHFHEEDFKEAVDKLPYTKGSAGLGHALHVTLSQLFVTQGGARPGVSKILIVVTNGTQAQTGDRDLLDFAAKKLRQLGVTVFVMGVGAQLDDKVLISLVTKKDNLFLEESFEGLMMITRQVANMACDSAGLLSLLFPKPYAWNFVACNASLLFWLRAIAAILQLDVKSRWRLKRVETQRGGIRF